ncbi:sugar phosphate isomerase/epimerase [Opitutaceae bacterium]|nr:sugar phosphate isomerase/epimerase [Opitutaceae bacterium]
MGEPKYQRTFSSLGCEELELDEVLALANQHGIGAVELRALGETIDLPGYFAENYETPARLAEAVARSRVKVVGFDASCKLMADDAEGEAELLALAPWAEALGGASIRVFDGGESLSATEIEMGWRRWRWWQEQRGEKGWRSNLMVETHDTLISAAAIHRFKEHAGEPIAILWDAFHTWSKGGESPVDTWEGIRDSVVHIHVKDGVAGGTEGRAFTHKFPGEGDFPMYALRERLKADGYAGPLSLEWGRKWHPYLPPLDDALRVAAERQWW